MTLFREKKEVSVLRADIRQHAERFLEKLGIKAQLLKNSTSELEQALAYDVRTNFEGIEKILEENGSICARIDIIDADISHEADRISSITGHHQRDRALEIVFSSDRKMHDRWMSLLSEIHENVTRSHTYLSAIIASIEIEIESQKHDIQSVKRYERIKKFMKFT